MVSVVTVTGTSSITEVTAWISSITSDETATLFHGQQIGGEALFELTAPDLKEMGVVLGPRKVVLKHLAILRSSAAAESTTGTQRQTDAVQAQLTEWLETHTRMKEVFHDLSVTSVSSSSATIQCGLCHTSIQAKGKPGKYSFFSLIPHQSTKDHKSSYAEKYGPEMLGELVGHMSAALDNTSEYRIANVAIAINADLSRDAFEMFTSPGRDPCIRCRVCAKLLSTPSKGSLTYNAKAHFTKHRSEKGATPAVTRPFTSFFGSPQSPFTPKKAASQTKTAAGVLDAFAYGARAGSVGSEDPDGSDGSGAADGSVKSHKRRKTSKASVKRSLLTSPTLDIPVECNICKEACEGDVVKCWMCKRSVHPDCAVLLGPKSSCNQCAQRELTPGDESDAEADADCE
jgi:hypothetical protein